MNFGLELRCTFASIGKWALYIVFLLKIIARMNVFQ